MAVRGAKRLGEFELIARYFRPLARDAGAFGLTDDAALYRQRPGDDLVLTADMIAEGIHFFADDPPASIAQKALRVNLSDLAAKGAEAFGYLLSLALPQDWTEDWLAAFSQGLRADQKRYGVTLLGGDTIRASGGVTINVTALGRIPKGGMLTRGGARAGEAIFVSGTIGDAALGLAIRLGKLVTDARTAKPLLDRYLHPRPRMALAPILREFASSAMDVSDGLLGDLAHICEVSKVGAGIDASLVPLSPSARRLIAKDESLLRTVLTGGDDYEVLATVPQASVERFVSAARTAGVRMTGIGQTTARRGTPAVSHWAGSWANSPIGHSHF
jgi:thiamine-monophosphate kinase